MPSERVPLYVRLPAEQAAALDRLVDTTGQRKQQLVSDLLADRLQMGRIEINESPSHSTAAEILTLEEAAELLRLPAAALAKSAEAGEPPGRRVGGEWRFSRAALMRWLSGEHG